MSAGSSSGAALTSWRRGRVPASLSVSALVCLWLLESSALAAPCENIGDSVIITGSSAVEPILAELGQLLSVPTESSDGLRIYYQGAGSCTGVRAVLEPATFQPQTLYYWDATGSRIECEVTTGDPLDARIGVSDVFPASCAALPNGLPTNVVDFQGPVQAMMFVVPKASSEVTLSAEAAYFIYGFGSASGLAPWTDESVILRRNAESGTQSMIAAAIGVPASRWKGTETSGTSALLEALLVAGSGRADSAIGILSAGAADENRATLTTLAYQDAGQACAVLPDRTAQSNEKENVRTGKYPIWGPLHFLTHVDTNRRPTSARVETVISFLLGTSAPLPGLDLIQLEAAQHIVPQCAMRVTRSYEAGPLEPHAPAQPCGCYYEAAANGSSDCEPCVATRDCGENSVCSYGYCEAL